MVDGFLGPAFVLTLAIHRLCVFLGLALFVAIWFAPFFVVAFLSLGLFHLPMWKHVAWKSPGSSSQGAEEAPALKRHCR